MPNATTYPWQWLWDSCFHAIVWAELGDERSVIELDRLFTFQADSGFVPHMNYLADPSAAVDVWGRRGASTITQPPMYGHAIAELARRGFDVPAATIEAAERGLAFLLRTRRRSPVGLVELCHPWESGCDDSARWDAALDGTWDRDRWRTKKFELVGTVETDQHGGAIANPDFAVASIGFNALVAFNARELADVTSSEVLTREADELADIISSQWDDATRTWRDDGALASTAGVRTLDAHFALLVDDDPGHQAAALDDLVDPGAFGALYGPAGVHRSEPSRDPMTYWRGPAWPQMTYLLWVAAQRCGDDRVVESLAVALQSGMTRSRFAEFWNPDTGEGLGAIPQSWAALGLVVS